MDGHLKQEPKSYPSSDFLRTQEVSNLLRINIKMTRKILKERNIPKYQISQRVALYKKHDIIRAMDSFLVEKK